MRHAVLFAGIPDRRHLNGLEFCYRTLVDHYGFESENIHVLIHDKSLRADGERRNAKAPSPWPGDRTPYRMRATEEGSRKGFRRTLDKLKGMLTEDDLLFINTIGHGGNYGDGRGPYLIAHPRREHYTVSEFCDDLSGLPVHGSLLMLMAQCFSGGFTGPVIEASRAKRTFVAAAAADRNRSFAVAGDNAWDSFQRNWMSALARRDVNGSPLPWSPATDDEGRINARAAFEYANDPRVKDPRDTPHCAASSAAAERMTLEHQ